MSESLRVLYIEDRENKITPVLRKLRKEGYIVSYQRVGTSEALKTALKQQDWDVILSAYASSRLHADESLAILHGSGVDIPFLIISDNGGEHTALNALKSGASDYLLSSELNRLVPSIKRQLIEATARRQQQRAERELKNSEWRYQNTLDNMLEGCQIIGYDWRYLYVNEAAAKHGKCFREELLGRTMMEVYPGIEETVLFSQLMECMESRASRRLESEFIFLDGTRGWFELSIMPVPEGIFVLSIDTTERKEAGNILGRLNTVLLALRSMNKLMVKEKDVDRLLHGICHVFNESGAYEKVWLALIDEEGKFKRGAQDGLDLSFAALLGELDMGRFPCCTAIALELGIVVMSNKSEACRNCSLNSTSEEKIHMVVRLEYDAEIYGFIGVSVPPDMAVGFEEEKLLSEFADDVAFALHNLEMEKQRQHSEELLRVASEGSTIGIYIVQDGKFQYINQQFQQYSGYSQDKLLGTDPLSYVFPDDREMVRDNAVATLKGKRLIPYEYRYVHKSGESRWAMEKVTTINYQGKRAVLGNYMDITEYKQLERKMTEYEELNRLKGDLLSLVSHELRTPLAAIKGYSTMLVDYGHRIDDAEKMEHLQSIDGATDRLTELVDHLLDMSRLEAGLMELKKVKTDIAKMVNHAVAEARMINSHREIIMEVPRRLPRVMVDPKRLRQVVDNLLDNACKYSRSGKKIVVSVRRFGREVVFSVTDWGIGIPPEELARVFDRMYRIKQRLTPEFSGLGLGLALCRGLVRGTWRTYLGGE
ncbi:PAS domain S-box protein [Chloroflexota bacterium]